MIHNKKLLFFCFISIMIIGLFILYRPFGFLEQQTDENTTSHFRDDEQIYKPSSESSEDFNQVLAAHEQSTTPAAQVTNENTNVTMKENLNIVAIGDSLTEGVGDESNNGGYVGEIEKTLKQVNENITIQNYGVRGNRTDQLLQRLDQYNIANSISNADLIFVTIGANDIMKVAQENILNLDYDPFQQEQVYFKERLRSIVTKILSHSPNAIVYLIGFYNPFEQYFGEIEQLDLIVNSWNSTEQSIANEFDQVFFIPTKDIFENNNNLFADDNFHPNQAGYQLMANRVISTILPNIMVE